MSNIEECGVEEGMPMVPPMPPQPQEDKGNPVTMNVSLNASGKDHVSDLIDMMKNAGLKDAEPVGPDMLPMRRDMERLRDIVDEPKDMDDLKPGIQDEPCPKCGKKHIGASSCMDDIEMDDEAVAEYDNEPEEEYKAIDDVINSGDDLHKSKKAYAATQLGDNPMNVEDEEDSLEDNIREELYKAIQAKMAEAKTEKFNEMGCVKEMKKLYAGGCAKNEMYKKLKAGYDCSKSKFEKLYASNCG